MLIFCTLKVELDAKAARKIADENGEITREDFFKFAIDTKLLDFGCVMGEGALLGGGGRQKKQTILKEGEEKKSMKVKKIF